MDYARPPKHLRQGKKGEPEPQRRFPGKDTAPSGRKPGWLAAIGENLAPDGPPRLRLRHVGIILLTAIVLYLAGDYYWREMRWRYIVIHHTASDIGDMEFYKRFHVEERGWSNIAYHFIINNGWKDTTVGQVEESELWKERRANLSTRQWYANYFGIAVVMVGNIEAHPPPPLQKEALVTLLTNLSRDYGIPPERIIGHREIQNTACPGKHLNMVEIRKLVAENLKER